MLEAMGCLVSVAPDGEAALHLASSHAYDLIFLDHHLGRFDGPAVSQRLRSSLGDAAAPPMIALTASAEQHIHQACLEAGMESCLVKPVTGEHLRSVLHRYCAHLICPVPARRLNILVVDDEPAICQMLTTRIAKALPSAEIRTAANGIQACAELTAFCPDVLLTDIRMPEMDGVALIRHIRENICYRHTDIVVLTGLPSRCPEIEQVQHLGVAHILYKPEGLDEIDAVFTRFGETPEALEEAAPPASRGDSGIPASVLDPLVMTEALHGNAATLHFIAENVSLQTPQQLRILAEALAGGRTEELCKVAHKLKGTAADIGARQLQEAIGQLITCAKSEDPMGCEHALKEVQAQWAKVLEAMQDIGWLEELSATA